MPASNPSIDVIDRRSDAPNRANISPVNDDATDDVPETDEQPEEDDELEAGEELIVEDGDHITYDVSEWAGASRTMLDALLAGDDIPHFWQGTELNVKNEYEVRVDELIDEVLASATPALDGGRDKVVYEVGDVVGRVAVGARRVARRRRHRLRVERIG